MKSSKDPKMKIDWVNFNKVDRHREQEAQANKVSKLLSFKFVIMKSILIELGLIS